MEWFSEHEWRLYDGVLERLQTRAVDGLVVLCGNVFAPASAVETLELVLHLDVDEKTLRERIGARVGNDYGKSPEEMEQILERHRKLTVAFQGSGVLTIDARQSLASVAGETVEAAARAQGTSAGS